MIVNASMSHVECIWQLYTLLPNIYREHLLSSLGQLLLLILL